MIRSGSSGALSDTAGRCVEATRVARLAQSLLRRERQDSRDVVEHVPVGHRKRCPLGSKLGARRFEQPDERLATGPGLAPLDPGDDRLRRARATRELALAQSGA